MEAAALREDLEAGEQARAVLEGALCRLGEQVAAQEDFVVTLKNLGGRKESELASLRARIEKAEAGLTETREKTTAEVKELQKKSSYLKEELDKTMEKLREQLER